MKVSFSHSKKNLPKNIYLQFNYGIVIEWFCIGSNMREIYNFFLATENEEKEKFN